MTPRFLLSVLLLLGSLSLAMAQPSDTVVPNPNAVKLQRIWMIQGGDWTSHDNVGDGAGSLGDISGDGLGDFAVRIGKLSQWRIYFGANQLDTHSIWSFAPSAGALPRPVVGDFWNRGHQAVGFLGYRRGDPNNISDVYYRLFLYQTLNGQIPETPTTIWDPAMASTPTDQLAVDDIFGDNLDGSPGDELIVVSPVLVRNKVRSTRAEIWIYRGGVDFQVDTPSVVIRDDQDNDDRTFSVAVNDFDGDGYLDLVTGCAYKSGPRLKIWFGRDGSPWNWASPDRVIELTPNVGINTKLTVGDYDGDRIPDLAGTVYTQPDNGIYVYLSRTGKSIRSRSFSLDDADRVLRTSEFHAHTPIGFLNDPSHRYEMLPAVGPAPSHQGAMLRAFSGSPSGPDSTYDAFYAAEFDGLVEGGIFVNMSPLPDCNGDGWDDLLTADPSWWGYDQGIAIVLSGGPMIPQDFPISSVELVASQQKPDALKLWPVPTHDLLNIYWRGDLPRMPARFVIHDIEGRHIAEGAVDPGRGAALWNCSDVPLGVYLLSVFDEDGTVIATARIVKQE